MSAARVRQDDSFSQLCLNTVIGTTTSSPNAFDFNAANGTFAVCAGSAVVVSHVSPQLGRVQRVFRARFSTQPINDPVSFQSPFNTPSRNRLASALRESSNGAIVHPGASTVESLDVGLVNKRAKETTCVSLSACGKLLAVGERGKAPRITIFSTAPDASVNTPLSVTLEHAFGIRSVAFSSDARWLCSLGELHDGYILLWSVDKKSGSTRLHSSNKCHNAQNIAWVGSSVVSFGVRHVKIWKLESTSCWSSSNRPVELENRSEKSPNVGTPKIFLGRNCQLLGLLDKVFTCMVAVSDSKAILCTDGGDVCLLLIDEDHQAHRIEKVTQVMFRVICVTFDASSGVIWAGGSNGHVEAFLLDCLLSPQPLLQDFQPLSSTVQTLTEGATSKSSIFAIGILRNCLITVDSNHTIELGTVQRAFRSDAKRFLAHENAILGAHILHQPNGKAADFYTWSPNCVYFWLFDGTCKGNFDITQIWHVSSDEEPPAQLKALHALRSDDVFIAGYQDGIIRVLDSSGKVMLTLAAHSAEIIEIAASENKNGFDLVASCSKDKKLQLFRKERDQLLLVQTIADHTAAVSHILFLDDGNALVSSSADRTIIIRSLAMKDSLSFAFVTTRAIALKANPVSISTVPNQSKFVIISTMDKQIQIYDIQSGHVVHTFKTSDPAGGDSTVLSSVCVQILKTKAGDNLVVAGISGDRSIRIYDYDSGVLLAKEHGQTMVSGIDFTPQTRKIVSAAVDGTIMVWDVSAQSSKYMTVVQPLHRILSKAEMSDFQKSLSDSPKNGHSPLTIRRKSSKSALVKTPKGSIPLRSVDNSPVSSTRPLCRHEPKQTQSPISPSLNPATTTGSNRRLSNIKELKQKSNHLYDLNTSIEQLSISLRSCRQKLSTLENLKPEVAEELGSELKLTIQALTEKTEKSSKCGESFDDYITRMIDERLARKEKLKLEMSENE